MARNHRIRFGNNNFAEEPNVAPVASSEDASFPLSNAQSTTRSKVWKPTGAFVITTSNQKITVNDGASKTLTITAGTYTTGAALATEIQTRMNISLGVTATVTYNTTTFFFEMSFTGSVTLEVSNQTNAVWDTIGFVTASDITGTSFTADDLRIHSEESALFDFGFPAEISFAAMIPPADSTLGLTNGATVKIQANNINDFTTSIPYEKTATVTPNGVFEFLDVSEDDDDLPSFRFWRIQIVDRTNPLGSSFLSIGHIYIGTYLTISARNVQVGFNKLLIDPTLQVQSDSGARFFDERIKFRSYSGLEMLYMDSADRLEFESFINQFGISTPFYVSLDPLLNASSTNDELTIYGNFTSMPVLTNVKKDVYSIGLDVREAI